MRDGFDTAIGKARAAIADAPDEATRKEAWVRGAEIVREQLRGLAADHAQRLVTLTSMASAIERSEGLKH